MNTAYISIGSNIGDRLHQLMEAVRALHSHKGVTVVNLSSVYETIPVGYTDQSDFLNLVVKVETSLKAQDLLSVCQQIENEQGRVRTVRWGPRTVDLDILLYNNDNIESENLLVPHPRMRERAFVLIPLLEMEPLIEHPVTGLPFAAEPAVLDSGVVRWMEAKRLMDFWSKPE
ncbi:2-amino-4-hydroxy-6-hydroxymethyldihydropteridine pyrophosphokinase [Sporosarcina sp. NCCP-2222]|uniref:2-amino-4-hydroxy-6- hydroxymethyldihydropteridine diphosphokinase n=1 Tax=Sporosarcina sp. NCCP-2222 TaxID=2935073 RepID=UPI002085E9B5|nr:2-amino-4-hydroxy-6-hydroxymethyldihydropteridine diphosphokinase [Sporosarcina sp. NCCP-2222]GKV57771.1 2-amino-4-hydroxy-6-hydroxymethyldihydropteridine pyrophosphokinase [Sporosarcina sp. NCCP-2222]